MTNINQTAGCGSERDNRGNKTPLHGTFDLTEPTPDEQEPLTYCPFAVVVDSREQAPYTFQGLRDAGKPLFVETNRACLTWGDYSVLGYENQICIERKSKADAFGTFISDRKRGEQQLQRMFENCQLSFVVIEASYGSVCSGPSRNGLSDEQKRKQGNSLIGSILKWQIVYPSINWCFYPTRTMAEQMTFRTLSQWWEEFVIGK